MYKGEPIKYDYSYSMYTKLAFTAKLFNVLCSSLPSITQSSYFDGITKLAGLLKSKYCLNVPSGHHVWPLVIRSLMFYCAIEVFV